MFSDENLRQTYQALALAITVLIAWDENPDEIRLTWTVV